ncbi:hypothetical protein BC936DRAFT_142207 [Jimgerdemannia flammicorona]|uniref:CobW/HypB/UreG nucleotide-binding domain-containing protein n=1 Tax=Jimgerdemannia flammicorona TaxID=994334 RepID=A0A433A0S1_9FUNG|nr:hypothetical protein BC936DRAFT_142207 [Jimgerdemannia flammicorona]
MSPPLSPVGSGKTALMLALCRALRDRYSVAAVTNDIFTREDTEFLVRNQALPAERIVAIETGGCPHARGRLADYIIYVIDVAGGDKIPRKGGPGITQSDLLVINKTDLATIVGADLAVMERDARKMRGTGPTVFAQVKNNVGVDEIIGLILGEWKASGAAGEADA